MDDSKKLAFDAIKEITTLLLSLGVGVYALVGAYLTDKTDHLQGKRMLVGSLASFGLSILCGGSVLMSLIAARVADDFDPTDDVLRALSAGQIIFAGLACLLFFIYLCFNFLHKSKAGAP